MDEFIKLSKEHFVRQHDGREPNATLASILLPNEDNDDEDENHDPNTVHLFEQWVSKEDYELHAAPNDNLRVMLEKSAPLLDGDAEIMRAPMIHFSK